MDTLIFFYTQAILVICIVTAVLSLAAYASSRRRFFIYGSGVFICYAIEMTEIFFLIHVAKRELSGQRLLLNYHACIADPCGDCFTGLYLADCHGLAR